MGSNAGALVLDVTLPPGEGAGLPPAAPSTSPAPSPVSAPAEPRDHRTALVQALTEGAARAFAAGDTRAALLALDTVRTLVGDAASSASAPVVDLEAERRKRGER